MKRVFLRTLTIISILISSNAICHADFQSIVRESVSNIETGNYNKAASTIDQLGNNATSHKILGTIYLHTGKLDSSKSEFKKSLAVNPHDWQSEYALGLISVIEKKPSELEKHLTSAEKMPEAKSEVGALRQYLAFLNGRASEIKPSDIPLSRETRAFYLIKSGKKDEALAILLKTVNTSDRPGFKEAAGPVATFDATSPVRLPNGKLSWKPTVRKDYPVVSGTVTLKAEIGQDEGVNFAVYYVDNSFSGITNCQPFQFEWKTNDGTNGVHEIRIEAKDWSGNIISKKTVKVRVNNISVDINTEMLPKDLSERIWNSIRVNDSRKVAHYQLGKIYLDSGDKENAIVQLEYVSAYQPDYRDTRQLLDTIRGRKVSNKDSKAPSANGLPTRKRNTPSTKD